MKKVKILFVSATHDDNLLLKYAGKLVMIVTGFRYAHVAGYILDGCYEAIAPMVMVSPKDKYDTELNKEIIEIEMTDVMYARLIEEASEILGQDVKYGIYDCLLTGIADVVSYRLAHAIYRLMPTPKTSHCSGVWARLLGEAGVNGFSQYIPDLVSPMRLYSVLKKGGIK